MANSQQHLRSQSANVPSQHAKPNPKLPNWLRRVDTANEELNVSRSVWPTSVATLGDYNKQLQTSNHQPKQSGVTDQPTESNFHPDITIEHDGSFTINAPVDNDAAITIGGRTAIGRTGEFIGSYGGNTADFHGSYT